MVGGRLPHFWLLKPAGKSTEKYSSLDLAATAAGEDGRPAYILFACGMAQQRVADFIDQLQDKFYPLKKIYLSDNCPLSDEARFAFADDRPSFLPPRFALLVRPDAHLAWMEIG
jgi:hypothetical protein